MKVRLTAFVTYVESRDVEMTEDELAELRASCGEVIERAFSEGAGAFHDSYTSSIRGNEWEIIQEQPTSEKETA